MAARDDRHLIAGTHASVGAGLRRAVGETGGRAEPSLRRAPDEAYARRQFGVVGHAVHIVEPRAVRWIVSPHDRRAAFGNRDEREARGGGRRIEVDHAVWNDGLLVVITDDDEHGVVPGRAERFHDRCDGRVGRSVRLERAVAVGTEHVCSGVGFVEMADNEVRSSIGGQHREQARKHLVIGDVPVPVACDIRGEHAINRPVIVRGTGAHHTDEVLVADDRGRRAACSATGIEDRRHGRADLVRRSRDAIDDDPVGE